jgi:ubiquinone biosynthesis protein
LYLLDLGSVGEVSSAMRELMIPLLAAFWQKDSDFLTDILLMLSGAVDRADVDVEAFREEIRFLMAKYRDVPVKDLQLGSVLQEMIEISFRHRVPLPASLTLTAKSIAQMQLVATQLDPEIDPFDVAGRFLMRSLLRRVIGKSDAKSLFYQSQKIKVRAMRVLEAFEQLIGARPGDKLSVNFRAASLEDTVRRAGRRFALALTAGFALLATALTAISDRVMGWVPTAFGLMGAIFVVALIVDLLRNEPLDQGTRTRIRGTS